MGSVRVGVVDQGGSTKTRFPSCPACPPSTGRLYTSLAFPGCQGNSTSFFPSLRWKRTLFCPTLKTDLLLSKVNALELYLQSFDLRYSSLTLPPVCAGKLYHRVRPTHAGTGFRWLLYDGYHRDRAPARDWLSEIPAAWTDAVAKALMRVNPLSSILQNLSATLEAPDAYVTLEDRGHPEIVAMIRHDHSTPGDLGPRTMVIMTREPSGTEYKRRVPATSRFWEPLAYPLLFPHGTLGWGVREGEAAPEDDQQINEAASQDKPTTQIWYYRRRLLQDERFQLFGRLTNEYLVDMFSRNLELRLQYIERNQRRIRAHEAQQRRAPDAELMENEDHNPSENVYLPASFLGSRRWAAEQANKFPYDVLFVPVAYLLIYRSPMS